MCGIFGAVLHPLNHLEAEVATKAVQKIMVAVSERGRDGYGWAVNATPLEWDADRNVERLTKTIGSIRGPGLKQSVNPLSIIGNFRAEPTTEYVKQKSVYDQQPYILGRWAVAHNGTIANDVKLRSGQLETSIDSAAIVEQLAIAEMQGAGVLENFSETVKELEGSYAILATHQSIQDRMFVACNYKPVWYVTNRLGTFFASTKDALVNDHMDGTPAMLEPYSVAMFSPNGINWRSSLYGSTSNKVLAVCSGGLDSVTAAYMLHASGMQVELAHFVYGCRAEQKEVEAIHDVAEFMGVPIHVIPMNIYDKSDSRLLRDGEIAGGEEGAEFAHEWVPARNLMMLSMATAYAEAKGFDKIMLGNNLEEAGAYPDNEPEFINKFNEMLPFAVGAGKRMEVIQPVGNMMKHEIVKIGMDIGAPLHLTWSCYKQGDLHCGQCGPCFMRKTAFEINGLEDPIRYETDTEES